MSSYVGQAAGDDHGGEHCRAGGTRHYPMDLNAFVQVLLNGTTYAQVHTVAFTNGELRGQIETDEDQEDSDRRR